MKIISTIFASLLVITLSISNSFATNFNFNPTPTEEMDSISYVVYFEGDIDEALHSDDAYIKTFIEVYQLEVYKTFELEHDIKGFVLLAPKNQYVPQELAKELSIIEDVYMVELEKFKKIKLAI